MGQHSALHLPTLLSFQWPTLGHSVTLPFLNEQQPSLNVSSNGRGSWRALRCFINFLVECIRADKSGTTLEVCPNYIQLRTTLLDCEVFNKLKASFLKFHWSVRCFRILCFWHEPVFVHSLTGSHLISSTVSTTVLGTYHDEIPLILLTPYVYEHFYKTLPIVRGSVQKREKNQTHRANMPTPTRKTIRFFKWNKNRIELNNNLVASTN